MIEDSRGPEPVEPTTIDPGKEAHAALLTAGGALDFNHVEMTDLE